MQTREDEQEGEGKITEMGGGGNWRNSRKKRRKEKKEEEGHTT